MEADRVDELIAAYALDALSAEEEEELDGHLRRAPAARERLSALQEAAASLAYGVDTPAPSPALRTRILDEARTPAPSNVVPLRRRWVVPVLAAVAAVAAGLAIGLGVWGSSLSSSLSNERAAVASQNEVLALFASPSSSQFGVKGAAGTLVVGTGARPASSSRASMPHRPGRRTRSG